MKKKKRLVIIGIICFFLFVLVGTTIIVTNDYKKNHVENRKVDKVYKPEQRIVCTKENARDDVTITEEVYLQNGELITRTNTAYWVKAEPKEMTCKYYTDMAAGLNGRQGVTSYTNCDDRSGRNTTTYTFSEIDNKDLKLKQLDFVDSQNKFDSLAWKIYMEEDNYTCEES